jgi:hypothetical protein
MLHYQVSRDASIFGERKQISLSPQAFVINIHTSHRQAGSAGCWQPLLLYSRTLSLHIVTLLLHYCSTILITQNDTIVKFRQVRRWWILPVLEACVLAAGEDEVGGAELLQTPQP